jgi:hypothetical protein
MAMLVLTAEEEREIAWREAHDYPAVPPERIFMVRIAELARKANWLNVPADVPIRVNAAGYALIEQALSSTALSGGGGGTLYGRPLLVVLGSFDDDVAVCAIPGVAVG